MGTDGTNLQLLSRARLDQAERLGLVEDAEQIDLVIHLRRPLGTRVPGMAKLQAMPLIDPQSQAGLPPVAPASAADLAVVLAFAAEQDLTVVGVDAPGRMVHLRAYAATIRAVFGVQLAMYQHPERRKPIRAHDGHLVLPAVLQSRVVAVTGLVTDLHHHAHTAPPLSDAPEADYPHRIADAYGFPPGTGRGQSIAIIELGGGYRPEVFAAYFQKLGMRTPLIRTVSVAGKPNTPSEPESVEVYLDVCIVGAILPEAEIVVYFAPDFASAIKAAVAAEPRHSAISISWGGRERYYAEDDGQLHAYTVAIEEALQDAMLRGIPVLVSTGDSGSSDVFAEDVHGTALTEIAAVSYPASSPYALACGGTTLHRDADNRITCEVVWNDLQALQGTDAFVAGGTEKGGATGGGVSALFSVPSYQRAAGIAPQTVNTAAPADRQVMRGIPDIAGNADKATGYVVACETTDSGLENYGGTSAVAPLWAALVGRLNEHLGGQRVGRLHGLLYSGHGAGCRDITEGDNNTSPPVGGYPAGPGWDASTGWGSPDGAALLALLQAQSEH